MLYVEIKTQSAAGETAPYWEMLMDKGLAEIKKEAKDKKENISFWTFF